MVIAAFSKRLSVAALAATVSLSVLTPASARDGQNRDAALAAGAVLGAIGIGMAIAGNHREPALVEDGGAYQAQYYTDDEDDYVAPPPPPRRPRYYDQDDYGRDYRYRQDYRRRDYPQPDYPQPRYQQQRPQPQYQQQPQPRPSTQPPQPQYQQRPAQPQPQQRPQQQYMPGNVPTLRNQGSGVDR